MSGRTQRLLERALELVREGRAEVVIVASTRQHSDHLRARIARLTSTGIPARLMLATPDSLASFCRGHVEPVAVLWDHHAHEVHASRLADEERSLRARLAEIVEAREHHSRIEVDHG